MDELEQLLRNMFLDDFPEESVSWLESSLQELWLEELAPLPSHITRASKDLFHEHVLGDHWRGRPDVGRWMSPRMTIDLYEPDRTVGPEAEQHRRPYLAASVPFATMPTNVYIRWYGPVTGRIAWSLGTAIRDLANDIRRHLESGPIRPDHTCYISPVHLHMAREGPLLEYFLYAHAYILPE